MRISQISVEDLFGTFDHTIPLNLTDHITIIHGPNGFGKTALLTMVANLFGGNYEALYETPFRKFELKFDDGSYITLDKVRKSRQYAQQTLFEIPNEKDKILPVKVEIVANVYRRKYGRSRFLLPSARDNKKLLRYAVAYADRLGLERITPTLWINTRTMENLQRKKY